MSDLKTIPGIGKTSLELLEVAGFSDAKSLAGIGADELSRKLEHANQVLRIAKRPPARGSVEKWILAARELAEPQTIAEATGPPESGPVNHEGNEEVSKLLSRAPLAIPLPARHLMDRQLSVSEIPPAILLNRYSGDLEVRVDDRSPVPRRPTPQASGYVQMAETGPSRLEIDTSRIKSIDDMPDTPRRIATSKSMGENDRVALLRAPLEKTNRGRDPRSRRYIRGVLHSHPFSIRIGAVVTLILMGVLPLAIVSAALLLLSDQFPDRFVWLPRSLAPWLLAFPLSLPVLGMTWFIWGLGGSCRICGQKLFVPKACLKNSKAHHIRGLGNIIPVSLHLLLFSWFRCTYCGTPVRLKK